MSSCNHSYEYKSQTSFRGEIHNVYRCEFCKHTLITPATAAGRKQVENIHAQANAAESRGGLCPFLLAGILSVFAGLAWGALALVKMLLRAAQD